MSYDKNKENFTRAFERLFSHQILQKGVESDINLISNFCLNRNVKNASGAVLSPRLTKLALSLDLHVCTQSHIIL